MAELRRSATVAGITFFGDHHGPAVPADAGDTAFFLRHFHSCPFKMIEYSTIRLSPSCKLYELEAGGSGLGFSRLTQKVLQWLCQPFLEINNILILWFIFK
jgi:hypothetical protein